MCEIEETVLEAIRERSKEDPLTRSELKSIVQKRDSNARGVIQSLREQGYRIASSAGSKGYWIAEDEADYKAFRAEYISKALTILRIIVAMDNYIEGQDTINGI